MSDAETALLGWTAAACSLLGNVCLAVCMLSYRAETAAYRRLARLRGRLPSEIDGEERRV